MTLRALAILVLVGLAAPAPAQDAPKPGPSAKPPSDHDVGTPAPASSKLAAETANPAKPDALKPAPNPSEKPADKDKEAQPNKASPGNSPTSATKSWEDRISSVSVLQEGNAKAQPVVAGPPPAGSGPAQAPGKVFAPFLPKPMEAVPPGWKLGSAEGVRPVPVEARLADGRLLRFQVTPPVLVPNDDGVLIVRLPVSTLSGEQSLVRHLQDLRASLETANKRLDEWKTALSAALEAAPVPPLPVAKPSPP